MLDGFRLLTLAGLAATLGAIAMWIWGQRHK